MLSNCRRLITAVTTIVGRARGRKCQQSATSFVRRSIEATLEKQHVDRSFLNISVFSTDFFLADEYKSEDLLVAMRFEQQQHDHNKQTNIYIYICTHAAFHSFGRGATPLKQHSQMITCFIFLPLSSSIIITGHALLFLSSVNGQLISRFKCRNQRAKTRTAQRERKENCAVDENIVHHADFQGRLKTSPVFQTST